MKNLKLTVIITAIITTMPMTNAYAQNSDYDDTVVELLSEEEQLFDGLLDPPPSQPQIKQENSAAKVSPSVYINKTDTAVQQKTNSENAMLRAKLNKSEQMVKSLSAKISELRNKLMVCETEVERIGRVAGVPNSSSAVRHQRPTPQLTNQYSRPDPLLSQSQVEKASEDMPIATVVVDKANLRAGPGTNNSPIMSVSKGTRLAIETRSGDWYRIIAPTGERAWISRDTIQFGRDPRSSPSRTVHVQSADRNAEERAMELLRNR